MVMSKGVPISSSYLGDDFHVEPNNYGSEGDWVTGHSGEYALECEDETSAPGKEATWSFDNKTQTMAAGAALRVETLAPAVVRWSGDGWRNVNDLETREAAHGVHVVNLPTAALPSGARIDFTFYWTEPGRWEGTDFVVFVTDAGPVTNKPMPTI